MFWNVFDRGELQRSWLEIRPGQAVSKESSPSDHDLKDVDRAREESAAGRSRAAVSHGCSM